MILPLNDKQLEELPQNLGDNIFRIMCEGKSVNICTGHMVGGNIINQYVYWDRPKEFISLVLKFLNQNNPNKTFRVERFK